MGGGTSYKQLLSFWIRKIHITKETHYRFWGPAGYWRYACFTWSWCVLICLFVKSKHSMELKGRFTKRSFPFHLARSHIGTLFSPLSKFHATAMPKFITKDQWGESEEEGFIQSQRKKSEATEVNCWPPVSFSSFPSSIALDLSFQPSLLSYFTQVLGMALTLLQDPQ